MRVQKSFLGQLMSRALLIGAAGLSCARLFASPTNLSTDPVPPEVLFTEKAQLLASLAPEDCGAPLPGQFEFDRNYRIEEDLFGAAEKLVAQELGDKERDPLAAANAALNRLKAISDREDSHWPAENRFSFKVINLQPGLVATMGIRSQASIAFFGIPQIDPDGPPGVARPKNAWKQINITPAIWGNDLHLPFESAKISALQRGPSGRSRFLADFRGSGCAGPGGEQFIAYEWDPAWIGSLTSVLHRDSVDSDSDGYKEQLDGKLIKIPFCWTSTVDTSAWPELCGLDTYDFSGDQVRFIGTETNHPDLQVIARALEYAQKRDLRALLPYCASEQVAQEMVQLTPPDLYFAGFEWRERQQSHESIQFSDDWVIDFELDKRQDQWFVSGFKVERMDAPTGP